MYLSREEIGGSPRYLIKETFKEGEQLKSHVLFDLGPDPSEFIVYPGGNSFYIDAEVELSITGNGVEVDTFELEDLFFPYPGHAGSSTSPLRNTTTWTGRDSPGVSGGLPTNIIPTREATTTGLSTSAGPMKGS